ncbi:MAG: aminoacyl-tRNA deacylase [Thermomicrobium sp.]
MSRRDTTVLEAFLMRQGVQARLLRLEQPTRTVAEAAQALGVSPHCIVKSLLFRTVDGNCVLAVVRGDQRVDRKLLAAALGYDQLTLAPAEQVVTVTGYPAGATPPVGHATPIPVNVDPAVLEEAVVYGGGGDDHTMLEIRPEDIVRVSGARVVRIAQFT